MARYSCTDHMYDDNTFKMDKGYSQSHLEELWMLVGKPFPSLDPGWDADHTGVCRV